jgi:hypothetical protein
MTGPRQLAHRILRQALVAAALAGFLCATAGFPLVVPATADKERSQPYPCMNHPCGCKSAEACWRGCCCFTMAQKLAWAEENGVTPPAFVVAAAKLEVKAASCCQARSSCCSDHDHSADARHDGCIAPENDSVSSGFEVVFVLSDASRKCQGLAPLWMLLSATTLAPPLEFQSELLPQGEVAQFSSRLVSLSIAPAVPPPRIA